MTWALIPILATVVTFSALTYRSAGLGSPLALFLWFQVIMAVGALPMMDVRIPADRVHASLMVLTVVITTVAGWRALGTEASSTAPRGGQLAQVRISRAIVTAIVIGIVLSTLYYLAVGYNVIIDGLLAKVQGRSYDATAMRLESYSGSRYLFPGYVNQIKNAALPALCTVVISALFERRTRYRWVLSGMLAVLCVTFLVGTGQRGAFVTYTLIVVLFLHLLNPQRFWRRALVLATAALPVFLLSTLLLGRADASLSTASGPFGRAGALVGQLGARIFSSNQEASVHGFRYLYELPIQNSHEWAKGVAGLLPGISGSDLDNRIYDYLYGTVRGTAPPSVWGSAYHNVGFIGTLIFALVLGLLLGRLSSLTMRLARLNTMTAIGAAGVTIVTGTWLAGSPTYLLNAGGVVFAALWLWGIYIERHNEPAQCA